MIKKTKEKLEKEKERHEDLTRQLAKVNSPAFIEKEARDKLNLGKEGEIVLILPSVYPQNSPVPTPQETISNWTKWINLFLR